MPRIVSRPFHDHTLDIADSSHPRPLAGAHQTVHRIPRNDIHKLALSVSIPFLSRIFNMLILLLRPARSLARRGHSRRHAQLRQNDQLQQQIDDDDHQTSQGIHPRASQNYEDTNCLHSI